MHVIFILGWITLLNYGFFSGTVESITSSISFDVSDDGTHEMVLDRHGLNIGSGSGSANLTVEGNAMISEQISIGQSNSSTANLFLSGTFSLEPLFISGETILLDANSSSMMLCDTSSSNVIVGLPQASLHSGMIFKFKKTSPFNLLWISGGGNSIDHLNAIEFPDNNLGYCSIISSGQQWHILSASDFQNVGSDNLKVHFSFNETSGNTWTDSIGGHVAVVTSDRGDVGNNEGVIGNSAEFNGSALEGASIEHHSDFLLDDQWTFSFWYRHNSHTGSSSSIIKKGEPGSGGYKLNLKNNPSIRFNSGGQGSESGDIALNSSGFNHYILSYQDQSLSFYVNGEYIAKKNGAFPNTTSTSPVEFEGDLDGALDEFRLYDRSLTPDEIYALYLVGRQ